MATVRVTEDPNGFEARFETAETAVHAVSDNADGRDYAVVPLPDPELRALTAERDALE